MGLMATPQTTPSARGIFMIGDRLGKWMIFKELGRGGMGRVYLAQEEGTGRQAAIKVLAAELAQDVGFLYRFQREIEALSQLSHPNIVRFYESGFENGLYFYAMEYIDGASLDEILQTQKRLPWREVLDIALQLCPALRHVHDHGVIHRDLKPSNIIRTAAGQVKLTDFGIAKLFAGTHLTATGGVVGTADFISPEQAAGKPVTKRSDLYSLGVVLYMLLVGRPLFEGNSVLDLLHKHRYAQFDKPQKIVPEIPYEIDEVVCQLLEKDPAKRPADCLVLGKQLDSIKKRLERRLTWAFWPLDQDTLYERGAKLMASSRLSDMKEAWREYLGPLEKRFPDHPYKAELDKFKTKLENAENPTPGEAQHFYQVGERLKAEGNEAGAREVWSSLVTAFEGVDAERSWVDRAKNGLADLEKQPARGERLKSLKPALDRAAALKDAGKADEAERVWAALEKLYSRDPGAAELLQEVRRQRNK